MHLHRRIIDLYRRNIDLYRTLNTVIEILFQLSALKKQQHSYRTNNVECMKCPLWPP